MITLRRINPSDGAGISRAVVMKHCRLDKNGELEENDELETPTVGWRIKLDSLDFWYITSTITDIISTGSTDEYDVVVFKTENSTYNWRKSK